MSMELAERIIVAFTALQDRETAGDDAEQIRAAYRALKGATDFTSAAFMAKRGWLFAVLEEARAQARAEGYQAGVEAATEKAKSCGNPNADDQWNWAVDRCVRAIRTLKEAK